MGSQYLGSPGDNLASRPPNYRLKYGLWHSCHDARPIITHRDSAGVQDQRSENADKRHVSLRLFLKIHISLFITISGSPCWEYFTNMAPGLNHCRISAVLKARPDQSRYAGCGERSQLCDTAGGRGRTGEGAGRRGWWRSDTGMRSCP